MPGTSFPNGHFTETGDGLETANMCFLLKVPLSTISFLAFITWLKCHIKHVSFYLHSLFLVLDYYMKLKPPRPWVMRCRLKNIVLYALLSLLYRQYLFIQNLLYVLLLLPFCTVSNPIEIQIWLEETGIFPHYFIIIFMHLYNNSVFKLIWNSVQYDFNKDFFSQVFIWFDMLLTLMCELGYGVATCYIT